jgi:hypothetical protein
VEGGDRRQDAGQERPGQRGREARVAQMQGEVGPRAVHRGKREQDEARDQQPESSAHERRSLPPHRRRART